MLNPLKSITFKTVSNDSNDMLSFEQINAESTCDIFDLWNGTYEPQEDTFRYSFLYFIYCIKQSCTRIFLGHLSNLSDPFH